MNVHGLRSGLSLSLSLSLFLPLSLSLSRIFLHRIHAELFFNRRHVETDSEPAKKTRGRDNVDFPELRVPQVLSEFLEIRGREPIPLENAISVASSSAGKTGAIVVHSCESASA